MHTTSSKRCGFVDPDHLERLLRETERTVIAHWREVEAVARALLERERLEAWRFTGSSSRRADNDCHTRIKPAARFSAGWSLRVSVASNLRKTFEQRPPMPSP